MDDKLQYIRILSIFHYVVGGLAALFACIPLIHFFIGLAMLVGRFPPDDPNVPAFVGILLMAISGVVILLGWAFAGCLVVAGYSLSHLKRYTFCLVMAGVECMFMPFGTVLGVFTIIYLTKPEVAELWKRTTAEGGNPEQFPL